MGARVAPVARVRVAWFGLLIGVYICRDRVLCNMGEDQGWVPGTVEMRNEPDNAADRFALIP
jgi:hypothetical protein